jgi:hypothetical protein
MLQQNSEIESEWYELLKILGLAFDSSFTSCKNRGAVAKKKYEFIST